MIFWISVMVGLVTVSVVWFHSSGISMERDRRRFLSRLTTAHAGEPVHGSEAGEIEEATLGLNKRLTLQWLRAAQARFRPIKAKVIG